MEVQYTNTIADFRAMRRSISPFAYTKAYARFLWQFIVIMLPGSLILATTQLWFILALVWCVCGALSLMILSLSAYNNRQLLQRVSEKLSQPTLLRINEDLIEVHNEGSWTRRLWSDVVDVMVTTQHVFILISKIRAFVVPRSAFASQIESERFVETLQRYRQIGVEKGHQPIEMEPVEEVLASVSYDNDAEMFVQIHLRGLGDPKAENRSRRSARIMVFTALMILVLLFLGRDGLFVLGMVGFAVSTFVMIAVVRKWSSKELVKNIEPFHLQPHTVVLTPAGVVSSTPTSLGFTRWGKFGGVRESDHLICLLDVGGMTFSHLIPKDAFSSQGDAEAFGQLVHSCYEEAVAEVVPAFMAEETGNPYQSP